MGKYIKGIIGVIESKEKYKIALQSKFVKFKVKHFVEIPTTRHDKAVPLSPLLDCLKSSSPPECVPTLALEVQQLPPAWLMTQKLKFADTLLFFFFLAKLLHCVLFKIFVQVVFKTHVSLPTSILIKIFVIFTKS